MNLILIFMAALCCTLLISSIIDLYVRHRVEPKMKMSQSVPERLHILNKKWDLCYAIYCFVIIIGGLFTAITGIAILYRFTLFVFSVH